MYMYIRCQQWRKKLWWLHYYTTHTLYIHVHVSFSFKIFVVFNVTANQIAEFHPLQPKHMYYCTTPNKLSTNINSHFIQYPHTYMYNALYVCEYTCIYIHMYTMWVCTYCISSNTRPGVYFFPYFVDPALKRDRLLNGTGVYKPTRPPSLLMM